MPSITLYGLGYSRSARCRWTLAELGLEYEYIEDRTLLRSDKLKTLQPQGKMPVAIIDDVTLFESAAICTYLCELGDNTLLPPAGTAARAAHYQWVSFAATEVEGYLWSNAKHTGMYPEAERSPGVVAKNNDEIHAGLKVLDDALGRAPFLLGDNFHVTDVIVGWTINWARRMDYLGPYANLRAYVSRLLARPLCALNPE